MIRRISRTLPRVWPFLKVLPDHPPSFLSLHPLFPPLRPPQLLQFPADHSLPANPSPSQRSTHCHLLFLLLLLLLFILFSPLLPSTLHHHYTHHPQSSTISPSLPLKTNYSRSQTSQCPTYSSHPRSKDPLPMPCKSFTCSQHPQLWGFLLALSLRSCFSWGIESKSTLEWSCHPRPVQIVWCTCW